MIVGIDPGNYETKVYGPNGPRKLLSLLGESRPLKLKQQHGPDDFEWEYQGEKGFAGTLAMYESEFKRSMMGSTKAHKDALIRILLALHVYGGSEYQIVVGQPIDRHTEAEKQRIIDMVKGRHTFTVSGDTRTLYIKDVRVAPEGGAAFWSSPAKGLSRICDVGSGTVNLATLQDGRYIDRDSQTLRFGSESTKSRDPRALVRAVIAATSAKWEQSDNVRICGGIAETVLPVMREHYVNADVIRPMGTLHPSFANAVGFYALAQKVFSR